jgi:hypothetical protein
MPHDSLIECGQRMLSLDTIFFRFASAERGQLHTGEYLIESLNFLLMTGEMLSDQDATTDLLQ